MSFLITGGNGQLGREWIDYLSGKNIEFKATDLSELDITHAEQVTDFIRLHKPKVIINCAAYTQVDKAEDDKELAFLVNAEASKVLAKVCREEGIKLIHYSTDYVFPGNKEDSDLYPDGYPEEAETTPISVYGESKLRGEQEIKSSGCDFLICRISWLCGRYGNNFVKTMLKLAETKAELNVVNDQSGCPTYTAQVVEQTFTLLKNELSGVFHLGSEGIISWYDFAKEIFRQKGIHITVNPVDTGSYPTKAKRPAFSKLNTEKISKIDGIHITHWKDGLKALLTQLS